MRKLTKIHNQPTTGIMKHNHNPNPNPNSNQKRGRSRSNGKRPHSNRNQSLESAGSDNKIRGSAQQILDKYLALARDAYSSGDRIASENYFQFAEHYYRIVHANHGGDGQNSQARANGQAQTEQDKSFAAGENKPFSDGEDDAGEKMIQPEPKPVIAEIGDMAEKADPVSV